MGSGYLQTVMSQCSCWVRRVVEGECMAARTAMTRQPIGGPLDGVRRPALPMASMSPTPNYHHQPTFKIPGLWFRESIASLSYTPRDTYGPWLLSSTTYLFARQPPRSDTAVRAGSSLKTAHGTDKVLSRSMTRCDREQLQRQQLSRSLTRDISWRCCLRSISTAMLPLASALQSRSERRNIQVVLSTVRLSPESNVPSNQPSPLCPFHSG